MEINVANLEKVCRTCLCEEHLVPIYNGVLQDGTLLAEVLANFIPSADLENARFPQNICSLCVNHLDLYSKFKNACIQNELLLKSCLENYIAETQNSVKELRDDIKEDSDCDVKEHISHDDYLSSDDDNLPLINIVDKTTTEKKRHKEKKSSFKHKKRKSHDPKEELENLTVKHEGDGKVYTCKQCNKSFPFKYKLVMHSRVHTKEKPFKCDKCNLSFSLNGNLKRHKMIHSGEKPHICKLCGKGFIQATSLQTHTEKHHNDQSRRNFPCKVCGRLFVRAVPYNRHMKKHHPAELEEQHAQEPRELKIEEPKVQYKCNTCNRTFDKLMFLKRHEFRHGEKKFLCSDCGKGFVRKADLQSHVKVHTGEKPHKCPICNKTFAHTGSLVTHSLVHSGYKPYSCYICSKSFTQLSHLKVHQRTHNGERPYSCSYCGKTFALKSNLTVHIRTHTGETPYVCTICGRGFYDSSSLKKHSSSHMHLSETHGVKQESAISS